MSTVELSIGRVRPGSSRRRGGDFAILLTGVRRAGLLERRLVDFAGPAAEPAPEPPR